MAEYVYQHCGRRVVVKKSMDDSGRQEPCAICGQPMTRKFTAQGFIMRPSGWNLRPGDRGYSSFARERELGELRDVGDIDLHGKVEEPEPAKYDVRIPDAQMQKFADLGRVVDRHIREDMELPPAARELVERGV